MLRQLVIVLFFSLCLGDQYRHFNGYVVYRVVPEYLVQFDFLKELVENEFEFDFWKEPSGLNQPVDVMVPPHLRQKFESYLHDYGVKSEILVADVERAVTKERQQVSRAQRLTSARSTRNIFGTYQRVAAINTYIDGLVSANPSLVSSEVIGKSFEGRDLRIIKISNGGTNKPRVWIDGGIHAREWISPATVLYIVDQIVTNATAQRILDTYDFFVLPVHNPDGYEYTFTNDRMWRKTRSTVSGSTCRGADPNRNYGYRWNNGGSSTNPCSDTYMGPRAFSEPETAAVRDYVSKSNLYKAFFTVHSYGQYWFTPWGWTRTLPADYNTQKARGDTAARAIAARFNTKYSVGSSTVLLYIASGGSDDWAYGERGIIYSHCVELRDTGYYGFQLPASQIVPTGQETLDGLLAELYEIKQLGL